jgi:hypothetical protein
MSLHTIKVTSQLKELRKGALSIVHNHAFLLLLPMKENELPNPPTKKPMECLPSQTLNGPNLTLENAAHFIKYTEKKIEHWYKERKIERSLGNMLSNYTT